MRYTIKDSNGLIDCNGNIQTLGKKEYAKRYHKNSVLAHIKLSQLEDIEDDLGMDLGIFVKILKYGGYMKTAFGIEKVKIRNNDIDFKGKIFYVVTEFPTLRTLPFKDYGINWALTREELENE